MNKHIRVIAGFLSGLVAIVGVAVLASFAFADDGDGRSVDGTIWVANRGADTIRGFDAGTGTVVGTVNMAAGSQPGDLAFARGKLYVAEERGASPAIAVVDPGSGLVLGRLTFGASERPHHVHASADGKLVAVGLYGTDKVAVVETRTDALLGSWDTNPDATNGRAHAGVFSRNGKTLYVASDSSAFAPAQIIALNPRTGLILWRMDVPGAHELVVTRDGKRAFVAQRTLNKVSVVDLVNQTLTDALTLGMPDTLRLSANDKLLTIGLRTRPAQVAVVNTRTLPLEAEIVTIGGMGTIAGHQWTSPNGRFTFAAFEGPSSDTGNAGVAVINHRAGNTVVQLPAYPGGTAGGPHGVDLEPEADDDDDDEDDEEDEEDD